MNVIDRQTYESRLKIKANIENKLRKLSERAHKRDVIATVDELNQYLEGNVTKLGLRMALNELINKL